MKKLLILSIFILLKCSVYGQLYLMDLNLNNYKTPVNTISESWENGNWENVLYSSMNRTNTGITTLSKIWNPRNDVWVNYYQSNIISTANGYMQDITTQKWDTLIDTWQNESRVSFIYNNNNDAISSIGQQWLAGVWKVVEQDKYDYTYDITGKRSFVHQRWDTVSLTWINFERRNYVNNINGTLKEEVREWWKKNSNSWSYYNKGMYTYNSNNQLLTSDLQDYSNQLWNDSEKFTLTYDSNEMLFNELIQIWTNEINSSVKILKNFSQENYINNNDGTVFQKTSQSWDANTNSWNNFFRETYDYSIITNNKKQIDIFNVKIYPNPSKDIIKISLIENAGTMLKVTDLLGNIIQTISFVGNEFEIDISTYSDNMYFLIIEQGNQISVNKIYKMN